MNTLSFDIDAMIIASQFIVGTHDFSSFRAAACQSNQPVRTVTHANLFQHGSYLILDIQADGFLHHMVRNIMGALFAVGRGEISPETFYELMLAKIALWHHQPHLLMGYILSMPIIINALNHYYRRCH